MDFKLPDIGEGVHEGEVTRWLVQAGDTLQADQPMVEVMTDKATVELPSPVAGIVESLEAEVGQRIEVGAVIIRIRENGLAGKTEFTGPQEAERISLVEKASPAPAQELPLVEPLKETEVGHVLAAPATRRVARELGVDLRSIRGTGKHGRITKEDVQLVYEAHQAATKRPSHPVPVTTALVAPPSRGEIERVPLRGIRRIISEAMARSTRTAAHFTYVEEVDMTELVQLRQTAKAEAEKRGVKLTFLPFVIKALIPALKEFPYLNASLDDERQEILIKGQYNIGVATDTPSGLFVPVIKDADIKSVWDLSAEIGKLSQQAREGTISLDALRGGTFTLTNAGTIGGVFATPVINHPEVAILGINAIRKRPVVIEDEIVIRHMMFLSLSVDHRVVDGADAARFMNRLVYFLSDPKRFVLA